MIEPNHQQSFIHKDKGVDSSVVHKNFEHALNYCGHIISDNKHSSGSRSFWSNIHEKYPTAKVSMIDVDGNETPLKDKESLVKSSKLIWDSPKSHSVLLKIQK